MDGIQFPSRRAVSESVLKVDRGFTKNARATWDRVYAVKDPVLHELTYGTAITTDAGSG